MLTLHLLGGVQLTGADGQPLRGLERQPQRLALLSYLLLGSPCGFHRRDSLLALFWPESGLERARAALRKALFDLRHELPAAVLESRGAGEIGIRRDALWCDALAFREQLAHDPAGALALYRGDLLPGFFLSRAPDFERWLEDERAELRRRALQAAASLAERSGDAEVASYWAWRALSLAPDNEAALRRLLLVLVRAGDRVAALRAFGDFARRLWREYELEPAPETQALIDRLRPRANPALSGTPQHRP